MTDNAKSPCDQDTPENVSFYTLNKKDGGDEKSNQRQKNCNSFCIEGSAGNGGFKGKYTYQSGVVVNYDLSILQSDESNKQSDTNRYCMFQVHWDRIENCLTHIGQR